jgi:hypothetical protein
MKTTLRHIQDFLWQWKPPRIPCLPSEKLATSDSELAWAAFEKAGEALDEAKGAYQSKVKLLPPQWRFVYVMLKLDGEVKNGGFHQFFTNARGVFDSHLADDIAMLPHEKFREILTRAFTEYRQIEYQDQFDNVGKSWEYFAAPYKEGRFEDEDHEYYEVVPEMPEVVGTYIRAHQKEYQ